MATPLKIEIIVDDKGSVKIRQVGTEAEKAGRKGEESFRRTGRSLDEMNRKAASAYSHLMKVAGAVMALAGTAYALKKLIDTASDLQEVTSKFNVVFAGQVKQAEQWAATLKESYAMSTREAKQYLSSVQDLLVPMGMNAVAAGKLSNEIVKLSADLGSFNNLPTAQVMADIQSALVGNYETMKKYGVVLNVTVVEEKALAMGLARTKDALTAADKAQAAYTLMVAGSTAAIGDMARTMGGYANQEKQLKANIEDLMATLGNKFLPVATDVVSKINEWVKANEGLINQKLDEAVDKTTSAVKKAVEVYNSLPDGVVGAAGAGIVGRILLGGPKGWLLGALPLLNSQIEKLSQTLSGQGLRENYEEWVKINEGIQDIFGGGKGGHGAGGSFGDSIQEIADALKAEAEEMETAGKATASYALSTKDAAEQVKALAKAIEDELADIPSGLYLDDEWEQVGQQIFNGYNTAFQNIEMSYEEMQLAIDAENEKLKNSTEDTTKYVENLWDKGLNRVQAAFADTFYGAMTGELDDLGDVFQSFFDDILRMVAELAAKMAMYDFLSALGYSSTDAGKITGAGGGIFTGGTSGGNSTTSLLGNLVSIGKGIYGAITGGVVAGGAIGGGVGSIAAGTIGALGGGVLGSAAVAGGVTTVAGALSALAAALPYAAAAIAALAILMSIADNQMKSDARGYMGLSAGISDRDDSLFSVLNATYSAEGFTSEDAKKEIERITTEVGNTFSMYEEIWSYLSEASQKALKESLKEIDWENLKFHFFTVAEEGAPMYSWLEQQFSMDEIWTDKNKTALKDSLTSTFENGLGSFVEKLETGQQSGVWTEAQKAFDDILASLNIPADLLQTLTATYRNYTGPTLADLHNALQTAAGERPMSALSSSEIATVFFDYINKILQSVSDSEGVIRTQLGSYEGTGAIHAVLRDYFTAYIEEGLNNMKASDIYQYMSDDVKANFEKLNAELFAGNIKDFYKIYAESGAKLAKAQRIWDTLKNLGEGYEYTTADKLSAMASAWGEAYAAVMKASGVEISDKDMAKLIKDYYQSLADGTVDINRAIMGVTELDVAVGALNGVFDAYIQQLKDLGVTAEGLVEVEKMRQAAMAKVLDEYKHSIGLISDETYYQAMIDKIMATYKGYFSSAADLIAAFADASLEELQALAAMLGLDWTDIADDIGALMKAIAALGAAGDETKRIIDAQRKLLGTTDTGWIEDIEKRFGMAGGTITSDWFNKIMAKFTAMSADDVKQWADTLGISVDQLIAYIMELADIFGVLGDSAGDAADKIKRAQSEMLGLTGRYEKELLERKYNLPEGTITEDYIRKIINKFTSMSAEEIEKWAKSLGVSVDDLIADIMRMIGIFDIVAMNIEDAAIKIKELFQGVNDFINQTGLGDKAARLWSNLLKLAEPFTDMDIPASERRPPTPEELANMSERLSEWFFAAEAAARELGQAELEAARLQIQVADRISALIDQIDETIRNIKYSPLDVSLPYQKAEAAQEDYDKLLSAALTGGPEDVSKYLGFAQTYLQQQQNNLKSSQEYQDVYASVMADMEAIKGIAASGGYDAKILEELQKGNELTVEQTEAYKEAMAEVIRKWELGTSWINDWLGKYAAADIAIKIKWEDYEGTMADALKMLSDLVSIYGWDHEYTLKFLADIPMRLFEDLDDLAKAAGWIADQSGGWNSKATIAFLKNVAENWGFENIDQILAAIGYVKTKAGSWTADATIAFIATLMDRYNIPIEDIDFWLKQMGITDTEILREVKIKLIYTMWSSGDLSLPEIAKYAFNQAMAAWLSDDATVAVPILKMLEGLASMWNVRNAYDLGYEVNRHYPAAADAEYWDDLWYHYGRAPQWAEGGIASGPLSGYPATLHGTELIIPMNNGLEVPIKWVNGGSIQADRPIDINLTIELDGEPLDIKIKGISSREADNVRVQAARRNLGRRRIY